VYSDADRNALHVRRRAARASTIPDIVGDCRRANPERGHPSRLRLLAENAEPAAACRAAGIVFIGPAPEAIAAMGDSGREARDGKGAACAGLPRHRQDDAVLEKEAARIGFPVLIKPPGRRRRQGQNRA
jgi:acetyl/propionyl-CoA carboxylase alpha subunit